MSPAARRPASVAAPAPVAAAGPGFLALDFYSGGFLLPPGRYAMDHNVVLHAFTDKNGNQKGDAKLGVMLTAYPLDGGAPIEQFESMGTKAHLAFMPSPDGKGVVAIPGGSFTLTNKANWFYYLESLYNCGLPQGIVVDSLAPLDGVWVVTDNIPEPEERKGFASTGEVEQQTGPKKMPVVVEIIDGGKPWEGGGGFPEEGKAVAAAVAPVAAAVSARPAAVARSAARAVAGAPAATAVAVVDGEALYTAAVNGIASVLSKPQNAKGMVKLMLKTATFKAVSDAESNEVASKVADTYFGTDDSQLSGILTELGFAINGTRIDPVAA